MCQNTTILMHVSFIQTTKDIKGEYYSPAVTTLVTTATEILSDNGSFSVELVVGVCAGFAFLLALLIGFLLGTFVRPLIAQTKKKKSVHLQDEAKPQPTAPTDAYYEQVSTVIKEEIELKSNQAYGPIQR